MALSRSLTAGSLELSYAVEDAAYQAVTKMSEDPRVAKDIKRLAFVKLWQASADGAALSNAAMDAAVFESALGAVPSSFEIVLHSNRSEQWALIDNVFDDAADFESYNPSTHPELNKLELCDSLLLAKVAGIKDGGSDGVSTVRLALKIIQVKTSRQIWSGVVEGRYNAAERPDNELLPYFVRKAIEAAAKDAVSKLPDSLNGYGVLVVPLEGPGGRAMTQVFMSALTTAGKQDKIRLYDLPGGNAADRMLGRHLWELTGSGKTLTPSMVKQLEKRTGAKGKLAVMTGSVVAGRVMPATWVDPTGAPVDRLTGSYSDVRKNPTHFEIVADLKIRDVQDAFRVVASVSSTGVYKRDVTEDVVEQARSLFTVRNIVVAIVILIILWFVGRFMFRVR